MSEHEESTTDVAPSTGSRQQGGVETAADAMRRMLHAYDAFDTQWRIDWGLSHAERSVITHLWAVGSAPMSEVAQRCGVSTGGATSIVDRLERDGYVERRVHESDRRVQLVNLTQRGRDTRSLLDDFIDDAQAVIDDPRIVEALGELARRFLATSTRVREHVVGRADASGTTEPLRSD